MFKTCPGWDADQHFFLPRCRWPRKGIHPTLLELMAGQSPSAEPGEALERRGLVRMFSHPRATTLLRVLCIRVSSVRACG